MSYLYPAVNDGAAGTLQIRSTVKLVEGGEGYLLFEPNICDNALCVMVKKGKEPLALLEQGLVETKDGRLLVQDVAGIEDSGGI